MRRSLTILPTFYNLLILPSEGRDVEVVVIGESSVVVIAICALSDEV